MGDIDLNFKSSVPAFDANMSLGRFHDHRVTADTVEETLAEIQTEGVARMINAVGEQRVMFGSRFPESALGPQLYNLHHCGLSDETLRAICAVNLERILKL